MNIRQISFLLFVLVLPLAFSGCGGEKKYSVSGSVSYKGETIEDGTISFVPEDTSMSPDGCAIVAGQYSCKVRPGEHTVRIAAVKQLPPRKGEDPSIINYQDLIPAKYNNESTLTIEVNGSVKKDYNLD